MQTEKRIFDDFAKAMTGIAGTMAGMGREAEGAMRERAREWVAGLDMVSREEFEAVKAMAAKARAEADDLKARVIALETIVGTKTPKSAPKPVGATKSKAAAKPRAATPRKKA